ncbi:MAG: hypothetical protein E6K11_07085 [Methanobacteriota archaeon]|nr:MAG: hypothetical protein E6K11_07085 [Euryarchaeota archaeon]
MEPLFESAKPWLQSLSKVLLMNTSTANYKFLRWTEVRDMPATGWPEIGGAAQDEFSVEDTSALLRGMKFLARATS